MVCSRKHKCFHVNGSEWDSTEDSKELLKTFLRCRRWKGSWYLRHSKSIHLTQCIIKLFLVWLGRLGLGAGWFCGLKLFWDCIGFWLFGFCLGFFLVAFAWRFLDNVWLRSSAYMNVWLRISSHMNVGLKMFRILVRICLGLRKCLRMIWSQPPHLYVAEAVRNVVAE